MATSDARWLRGLVLSSIAAVLLFAVGATVAIHRGWAVEWAPLRTGLPADQDFVFGAGTAMSPPLGGLVAQALLTLAATMRNRWGSGAVLILVLGGLASAYALAAEPITRTLYAEMAAQPLAAMLKTATIVAPLAMSACGILELVRRAREGKEERRSERASR